VPLLIFEAENGGLITWGVSFVGMCDVYSGFSLSCFYCLSHTTPCAFIEPSGGRVNCVIVVTISDFRFPSRTGVIGRGWRFEQSVLLRYQQSIEKFHEILLEFTKASLPRKRCYRNAATLAAVDIAAENKRYALRVGLNFSETTYQSH
jgi:hypothetical protein